MRGIRLNSGRADKSPLSLSTFAVFCRAVLLALVGAAGLLAMTPSSFAVQAATSSSLYAQKPCTPVYGSADTHSTLLTQLLPGTEVKSLGQVTVGAQQWAHVSIWSGIEGYIPSN